MNDRPHLICLTMASVDGKILGDKWGNAPRLKSLLNSFEQTHETIGNKSWIVGRTTMEKDFTKFAKPDYKISRENFVATNNAYSFAIAIEGKGKMGWETSYFFFVLFFL